MSASTPGRAAIAAVPLGRRRSWSGARREALIGWLIVGPVMLYYAIFNLVPIAAVVALSFVRWTGFSGSPEWVGLHNYELLWRFPAYLQTFWHTLYIGGFIIVTQIAVGFVIALLLNANVRGRGVYRTIWYLPTIVTFAIVTQMFGAFLDPTSGAFNAILRWAGQPAVDWSLSAFWMIFWVIVLSAWKGVGAIMIIFLAGLQSIDPTLYEAGRIDGAGRLGLLRYITLPALRPVTVFVVISGALGSMQIFEPVQLLSKGGPFDATTVVVYRIYEDAFQNNTYGVACATSVVFALLAMGFTAVQLRTLGHRID